METFTGCDIGGRAKHLSLVAVKAAGASNAGLELKI
jgi:hypothetical protein